MKRFLIVFVCKPDGARTRNVNDKVRYAVENIANGDFKLAFSSIGAGGYVMTSGLGAGGVHIKIMEGDGKSGRTLDDTESLIVIEISDWDMGTNKGAAKAWLQHH